METIITIASILLIDIVLLIVFGIANYKGYHKENFNFLGNFPYEMHNNPKMEINNYVRSTVLIFGLASIFLQILLFSSVNIFPHSLALIMGTLSALGITTLFFINLNNPKLHMLALTIGVSFTILSYVSLIYLVVRTPLYINNKIVLYIIGGLLAISELVIIVHPKMKTWMKYEREESELGEVVYKRGRYNYLAFVEWFTFFNNIIYLLLSLIFILPTFI